MKTFRDYIAETEVWIESPVAGDDFAIELAPDCLYETYVLETVEDGIIVEADDQALALLQEHGALLETIRTYGAVGNSGTGQTYNEQEKVNEGAMKELMHQDAERMELTDFVAKYGDQDWVQEFWHNIRDDVSGPEQTDRAHWDFGRMLELAGVADHRYDRADDVYHEDQSADIVAKKELDMDAALDLGMTESQQVLPFDSNKIVQLVKQYPLPQRRSNIDSHYEHAVAVKSALLNAFAQGPDSGLRVYRDASHGFIKADPSLHRAMTMDAFEDINDFLKRNGVDIRSWDRQQAGLRENDISEAEMDEAKYQGREVALGKPMQGDVKKFKVYVRDPKTGNVKKVNFGDKTMRIKKSNPARRRSFRARHRCSNPGPRTKARYWSCRKW